MSVNVHSSLYSSGTPSFHFSPPAKSTSALARHVLFGNELQTQLKIPKCKDHTSERYILSFLSPERKIWKLLLSI